MTEKEFEQVLEKARVLRAKKNHDYGNAFMASYNDSKAINSTRGNVSIYWDLKRKFDRLDNLLLNNSKMMVADETLEDTLLDISIMCVNAIVAIKARNLTIKIPKELKFEKYYKK